MTELQNGGKSRMTRITTWSKEPNDRITTWTKEQNDRITTWRKEQKDKITTWRNDSSTNSLYPQVMYVVPGGDGRTETVNNPGNGRNDRFLYKKYIAALNLQTHLLRQQLSGRLCVL